jgi:hypothetical protein
MAWIDRQKSRYNGESNVADSICNKCATYATELFSLCENTRYDEKAAYSAAADVERDKFGHSEEFGFE